MPASIEDNRARLLRSPDAVACRRRRLREPHIAPLTDYVATLRAAHPAWEFPDFDPLDGGVNADLLFLLEKPGPRTAAGAKGSGFISRDNDNATAEAILAFMRQAGIARQRTVIWNVVPGWNGTMRVTTAELLAGLDALKSLLPLLSRLRTVVLVGQRARRAEAVVRPLGLRIFASAHPSPQVRASRIDAWRGIPLIWARANQASPGVAASG